MPTHAGVDAFVSLAEKGVTIDILTNALEATDVIPVHAGYAKHRKALLKAGIRIHELRQLSSESVSRKLAGPFGSSSSSLHAKTFAIDRKRIFIGSFNFDPRSMNLNTELGFIIESPKLASDIQEEFYEEVQSTSYEVKLDKNDDLYWTEQQAEKTIRHNAEPGSTFVKRLGLSILSVLPIDWLL